ncbi:MAG: phosphoenolpyruvate carboxylase [Verrucomicrobiae bacterium]|nr:phosphoenolpyruvate carboxylase [Verrucomicrobiae bacterium]
MSPKIQSDSELFQIGFEKIDRDLSFLVECFKEVLVDIGEPGLARLVPAMGKPLSTRQKNDTEFSVGLGQVYSIFFQLLNMVEENTAAQIRRMRESSQGMSRERGLWGYHLQRLKAQGLAESQIASVLGKVRIEPVLTAHPTEAKRATVLDQHRSLYLLLVKRENQMWTPAEQEMIRKEIRVALERLWRTGEILLKKPDVASERRYAMHYLRNVFTSVLPFLDARLRIAWKENGFHPDLLSSPYAYPRLSFGTWIGGDRDGHPLVTSEVTGETLADLRHNAFQVIHRQLQGLSDRLTLSEQIQKRPLILTTSINRLVEELGERAYRLIRSTPEEPWKQFIYLMMEKLPVAGIPARSKPQSFYRSPSELVIDLHVLYNSLIEVGAVHIAEAEVMPVLRTLNVFGFHLARLDIRQNSRFHEQALTQLICSAGINGADFAKWPEERKLEFLNRELLSPRPFTVGDTPVGPEADEVIRTYRVLARHLQEFGPEGLGSLIVSMTRQLSDLLIVYVLARESGLMKKTAEGLVCLLPVVPLLETIEDLERGPELIRAFLEHPITRRSMEVMEGSDSPDSRIFNRSAPEEPEDFGDIGHQRVQQVMIGYSDSNKDSGLLASQWALHQAQLAITREARALGVRTRYFHGRGGTISRGAGPTHRFLEALPDETIHFDVRMTEQGEAIGQKYSNFITATYNLELLMAGVTGISLSHFKKRQPDHPLSPVLGRLAGVSKNAYKNLIACEGFIQFHSQATPIDVLEASRIGSRPTRRTGSRSLEDLRAIPWVFSWTQARYYLPGWYGVGSAFEYLAENDAATFDELVRALPDWPFLRYVLNNVETNLASADLEIMKTYASLVGERTLRHRVFALISDEFARTQKSLERLFGESLAHRRPRMNKTLHLRSDALNLLHHQQVGLLQKWRGLIAEGDEDSANFMLPQLLLSVNAIASGLRTTG